MTESVQTAEERQTEALRVLLVDDHDLFRTGLRNLLEEQGLAIVGEAATGAEAGAHVRTQLSLSCFFQLVRGPSFRHCSTNPLPDRHSPF